MSRSIESVTPFRGSSEIPDPTDALVTGQVPEWLRGELVRTCPAVFEGSQWRARHWFDGLCLLYAFRIGDASISFRSRLLESEAAREIADDGRLRVSAFGTPTGRRLWERLIQPVQRITDNTNVNVVRFGDDLVALTEGDRQQRIDPASLHALGTLQFDGDHVTGAVTGAHPHFDDERVINFATKFGSSGVVSIYEHGANERRRRIVGSWRTNRVPYLHAFGLTPAHAILIGHPFTAKSLDMLWSNRGFIDHFEWRPQDGTRLVVMDRATGAIAEYETDAMFAFHTVNAFERGDATVLDVLAYPTARIVGDLRVDRMIEQLPDLRPTLTRLVMTPGRRRAEIEKLGDTGFEFPSINYRRVNGRDYRFAWGAADGPCADGTYASSIVKVDVRTGTATELSDGEHIYGEPVFVARPNAADEDDGVLLSVGSSTRTGLSKLAIIDARTTTLLASAGVERAIPLGFHGSFIGDRT
jgi:carotenoid cleavage dioxygenase-like enzyme